MSGWGEVESIVRHVDVKSCSAELAVDVQILSRRFQLK